MRLFIQDQIASAQKTNARALLDSMGKRLDGIEKLGQLNLEVVQRALSEQVQYLNRGGAAHGIRGLLALQSEIFAQLPGKLASYNQRLHEIALATQSELSRESQSRLEAHWMLARTLYGRVSDDAAAPGETALLVDTAGEMPPSFEDAGPPTRQVVEPVNTDGEAVDDTASGPAASSRADEDILRKP